MFQKSRNNSQFLHLGRTPGPKPPPAPTAPRPSTAPQRRMSPETFLDEQRQHKRPRGSDTISPPPAVPSYWKRGEDWKSRPLLTTSTTTTLLLLRFRRAEGIIQLSGYTLPTRQHFLFSQKKGDWKSRPLLPGDTYTAFRFLFLKSELKIQLFLCHSIRWPCFHLSKERIENPTVPASLLPSETQTVFFFFLKERIENSIFLILLDTPQLLISEEQIELPTLQLSCDLTCRLDRIFFLPEERIENPDLFGQPTRTQFLPQFHHHLDSPFLEGVLKKFTKETWSLENDGSSIPLFHPRVSIS